MFSLRKWLPRGAVALSVVGAALAIGACGGSSTSSTKSAASGKFTIADYGDSNDPLEELAVKTYNATPEGHKVKAVLTTFPGANYSLKLQTIIDTSAAPDLFFNWGAGSIDAYVKDGLLMPLNSMFKSNPKLLSSFLPSIMTNAKVGSNYYGIPIRGTQPVFLYYNKPLLAKYHLSPPATWNDLLHDVDALKSAGFTNPIALGGGDEWPELMWLEYIYDRVAGSSLVVKAEAGDHTVWASAASKKALSMTKQLIKMGAFGDDYDSIKETTGASSKMLVTGKSAFELMGSWEYSTILAENATFAKHDLGWTTFPTIPGGKGNNADLVGNTQNYYSVEKKAAPYTSAIAAFFKVMYSPVFLKKAVSMGWLPTTTNTGQFIKNVSSASYLTWQLAQVKAAPHFQNSWDQSWPPTYITPMHNAIGTFFNNTNAQDFISYMETLPAA